MILNTTFPVLIQFMLSLVWRNVLVLYDGGIDTTFFPSLDIHNIAYVNYDITSSTDEHLMTILSETHHLVQPVQHMLLLCDHQLAVRVLQKIETVDAISSVPYDIRHSSQIMMMGTWRDLDVIFVRNTLIENLVVVERLEVERCSGIPTVWTLMFAANGRVFTPVSLPNWPSLEPSAVFPNIKYGYNGRQLTVVMKPYKMSYGHITVGNQVVPSISYRVLEYMAISLNFTPNVVYPREDEWGRDVEGSWTGVIGMLHRKEADLAAVPLLINNVWAAVIDHILPPIMENKVMILYKMEDDEEDNLMVYLQPFQAGVYVVISVSLFIYSLLLCFERHYHKARQERETFTIYCHKASVDEEADSDVGDVERQCADKICFTFLSAFQDGFMASLRQGLQTAVSRDTERLLVLSWWIFTIIISSIYCGVISSSFTVRIRKPPFSNLGELAERPDYVVGYDSSSFIATYLEVSTQSEAVSVRNRARELATTDPDVLSSNLNKHLERVQEGKYALLVGVRPVQQQTRSNCLLQAIDTNFGTSYAAFAVPKLSPYKKDLERSMHRLRDIGGMEKVEEEWLRSIPLDRCDMTEYPRPISLTQLCSIFIVVGVGICCAIMALLVEKMWSKVNTD